MLMRYVASFVPTNAHTMAPERLTAYDYVDDGAFAEPWLGIMPWLTVSVWKYGLQQCLGGMSLRTRKKEAEGDCATKIALLGMHICTTTDTIALPPDMGLMNQEFLTNARFGPELTRVRLKLFQDLAGWPNAGVCVTRPWCQNYARLTRC